MLCSLSTVVYLLNFVRRGVSWSKLPPPAFCTYLSASRDLRIQAGTAEVPIASPVVGGNTLLWVLGTFRYLFDNLGPTQYKPQPRYQPPLHYAKGHTGATCFSQPQLLLFQTILPFSHSILHPRPSYHRSRYSRGARAGSTHLAIPILLADFCELALTAQRSAPVWSFSHLRRTVSSP